MIGKKLANTIIDKNAIKRQIGTRDSKLSLFKPLPTEELNVKQRYVIAKQRNIYNDTYDSFILGHDTNGKLETQTGVGGHTIVLGDYRDSWVIQRVVQGEGIYREWFYDDVFKDSSTTATWDTTNHQVSFTAGQTAISTSIYLNNETINQITMTAEYTGTLSFYASADGGSNWESVTLGELHIFTHTGTDLRWKVTESGSSTATLNKLIITINGG